MKKEYVRNIMTYDLFICSKEEYIKWKNNELFLFKGNNNYYLNNKPQENCFYSYSEVINFEKNNKYNNFNINKSILEQKNWYNEEKYIKYFNEYFNVFIEEHLTPNKEKIIIIGYYGFND